MKETKQEEAVVPTDNLPTESTSLVKGDTSALLADGGEPPIIPEVIEDGDGDGDGGKGDGRTGSWQGRQFGKMDVAKLVADFPIFGGETVVILNLGRVEGTYDVETRNGNTYLPNVTPEQMENA